MKSESFSLIIITQETSVPWEAGHIIQLFEAGLQTLHLRKPSYTLEETRKLLTSIPAGFHPKIVLHNHYELLQDFDLKGSHLPERLRTKDAREKIKKILSTSFHLLGDIVTEKMNFEYVLFSPVFHSISKKGHRPKISAVEFRDFFQFNKNLIRFPVIGLGGITDQNIIQVKEMGFNGAACIGYIWESPDPIERFKKLQKILQG